MVSRPLGLSRKSSPISGNKKDILLPSEKGKICLQASLGNCFLLAVHFWAYVASHLRASTSSLTVCVLFWLLPFCWDSTVGFSKSRKICKAHFRGGLFLKWIWHPAHKYLSSSKQNKAYSVCMQAWQEVQLLPSATVFQGLWCSFVWSLVYFHGSSELFCLLQGRHSKNVWLF